MRIDVGEAFVVSCLRNKYLFCSVIHDLPSMRSVLLLLALVIAVTGCQASDTDSTDMASDSTDVQAATDTSTSVPVAVELLSYGFETERDTFVVGQPYEFTLNNSTAVEHEWVLVPRGAETEDNMLIEVEGDDLPPDSEATITYTFEEAGEYDFACYLEEPADHYEQGMVHPVVAVEE